MRRAFLATTALTFALALPMAAGAAEPADTKQNTTADSMAAPGNAKPMGDSAAEAADSSVAQGKPDAADEKPEATSIGQEAQPIIEKQADGTVLADRIIGLTVRDLAGKKIGKVDDIILDDQGRMSGLIVSVGGFIGIGSKKIGLRLERTRIDLENQLVIAQVDEDAISRASEFETRQDQLDDQRDGETMSRLGHEPNQPNLNRPAEPAPAQLK